MDIEGAWTGGCRAAGRFLKDLGYLEQMPAECPFSQEDLLAADFEVEPAVTRITIPVRVT